MHRAIFFEPPITTSKSAKQLLFGRVKSLFYISVSYATICNMDISFPVMHHRILEGTFLELIPLIVIKT